MNKGFTLTDLIMGIAILAILSAAAIPSYKSYRIRAQITNAAKYMLDKQLHVINYHNKISELPNSCGVDTLGTQFANDTNPTPGLSLVRWCATSATAGRVEGTLTNINSVVNGRHIWLIADASNGLVTWTCGTSTVAGEALACQYLPSHCQVNCL